MQAVITGADRIAANGDTANKIGTYSVATLARAHGIPFYVAAPTTTFDLSIATGREIPIEQRAAEEITHGFGRQTAPDGVAVYNPAFDVTPAELIAAIITDRGVIRPVNVGIDTRASSRDLLAAAGEPLARGSRCRVSVLQPHELPLLLAAGELHRHRAVRLQQLGDAGAEADELVLVERPSRPAATAAGCRPRRCTPSW